MARVLLAYSTVDGHTRTIGERLRRSLADGGDDAALASLDGPDLPDVAAFDKIVVGASIRYGRHRANVLAFVERHRRTLETRPSAFFSVNVVARKPGKDTAATNPYVKDFLRRTTWKPALVAVFAGRIDYPHYGFVDRQMIRLIMALTHGPTDPRSCVEFTDWNAVDDFARQVASAA